MKTPPNKPSYKRISKELSTKSKLKEQRRRRTLAVARQREKRQLAAAPSGEPTEVEALMTRINGLEAQLILQAGIITTLNHRLTALEYRR